jgi:outer membrane protein assembly factor BamB
MNGVFHTVRQSRAKQPKNRSLRFVALLRRRLRPLVAASLSIASFPSNAENWAHWRGPRYDGSTSETSLPSDFSRTENVSWSVALPGTSAATPIIWEDFVFLSSGDDKTKGMRALCLDRKTGKVLWNQEVGVGYNYDEKSNFSSPSPVTDGKLVVFVYGNGEVAAFDFSGKKLWQRSLQKDYGPFTYQWTYGASPTIYENQLLIQVLRRDVPVHGRGSVDKPNDSYLLALVPQTGKELWRNIRPSDARQESHEAYSTPIPIENNGRAEILITGGDCITGHNPKNGEELWRWGTWNPDKIGHWRLVPSPVAAEGIILACAPKGSPVYAFKAGAKGKQDDSVLAWKSAGREITSDVATPLFYNGRFYVLRGEPQAAISRVVPATGKVEWSGELPGRIKIESSPVGADNKIYFQNFRGEVFIVGAGEEFKLIRTIPMGDEGDDQLRSSIAISHGELFIRTGHKLYCVGASGKVAGK